MIAALPMYDRPEVSAALDRFWAAIRAELPFGPDLLRRDMGMWDVWESPDLFFSQTCGLPYRNWLIGRVQKIGTPDYGLPDAPPGYYYSHWVVAQGSSQDLRSYANRTLAINGRDSQSGWTSAFNHAAELGFEFHNIVVSGAHRESARMIADGKADIAAIDAVTWRMMEQFDPFVSALEVIGHTIPTPGLPFITSLSGPVHALREATEKAIEDLSDQDRDILGMIGIADISDDDYRAVHTPHKLVAKSR